MVRDFFEDEKLIDWSTIDQFQAEGTISGLSLALIESEKLLDFMLTDLGVRGKNIYERVKNARERFSDLAGLASAMEVKEKICAQYGAQYNSQDLITAIERYRTAIKDLTHEKLGEPSWTDKVQQAMTYYFFNRPGFMKRLLIWLVVMVALILILDGTHPGQKFIHFLAKIISGAISWIFGLGILIALAFMIVIGIIFLLERKKKK